MNKGNVTIHFNELTMVMEENNVRFLGSYAVFVLFDGINCFKTMSCKKFVSFVETKKSYSRRIVDCLDLGNIQGEIL